MRFTKRELGHLGLSLAIGIAFSALTGLHAFDPAHDLDIDFHHAVAVFASSPATEQAPSSAVVVALDEATYASKPFAGLPRVMWTPQIAAVQDAILDGGAKVVGWDLILPTSAATYVADQTFDRPLMQSLSRARQHDRIILGMAHVGGNTIQPHRLFLLTAGGAKNLRSLNVVPGADGVVRSVPSFVKTVRTDGSVAHVPSMALELAARLTGDQLARLDGGGVKIGERVVRGVQRDRAMLNFAADTPAIPTFSFADLWNCAERGEIDFFRENFEDKAVLLGLVLDVEDRKLASNRFITDGGTPGPAVMCSGAAPPSDNTPARRATTPGVYLLATAVNNLVNDNALVGFSRMNRMLLVLPLAVAASVATLYLGPFSAGAAYVLAALGWLGLGTYAFDHARVVPLILPLLAGAFTFVCVLGLRFVVLERQGRFLRRAFASYVAPELVDELVKDPDRLKLGGERREMSFLFSDLEGFTGFVEQNDPTVTVPLLNAYLDELIDIAKRNGGTIDKVIGDAVVVIFSAPVGQNDHAQRAVACALEMDRAAQEFSRRQVAKGIAFGDTRIGVHTGAAVVGNFGGSGFFDYTAIGDTMNTAARLEGANKHLGTRIAVSGDTVRCIPEFHGRPVGRIVLKGKTEPVEVHQPLTGVEADHQLQERYRQAYDLLDVDLPAARSAFDKLSAEFPDDPIVALHQRRVISGETGTVIVLDD